MSEKEEVREQLVLEIMRLVTSRLISEMNPDSLNMEEDVREHQDQVDITAMRLADAIRALKAVD